MVAADGSDPGANRVRLAKHLAHAGIASRRAAETIVGEGRVRVGGELVTDPARDVADGDEVTVDGSPIGGPEPRVVYALNKPVGVVSTARDTHGRPTVTELIDAPGAAALSRRAPGCRECRSDPADQRRRVSPTA